MIQILKRLCIFLAACAALVLSGCNQAQHGSSAANTTETGNDRITSVSIKSEVEIKQDLSENPDFYTLFDYNCYDSYGNYSESASSIDELSITRRKTGDIIWRLKNEERCNKVKEKEEEKKWQQ